MENKKINKNTIIIALSSIITVLLIVVIVLLLNKNDVFSLNNKKSSNTNLENSSIKKDINDRNKNNIDDNIIENNNQNNNNDNKENNNEINKETSNNDTTTNNNVITTSEEKNEKNLLSYFETQVNSINENSNQEDVSLREKIKNGFVDVVDFIFYGKEIKGYTFKELTQTAKIKVISLALKLDNKIEKYFPNYKENIKDKYNDIKGKLSVKYIEVTDNLCKSVGEDTCNQFKKDFSTMKKDFGLAWSLIKELASDGASSIKKIYENWRD